MKYLIISILIMNNCINHVFAQDEVYLNKDEIIKLLAGNSVSGKWNGRHFKQNILENGFVNVNFDGALYKIPWKVNSKNEYCENWGDLGWYCSKLKQKDTSSIISIRKHEGEIIESKWQWYRGFIELQLAD